MLIFAVARAKQTGLFYLKLSVVLAIVSQKIFTKGGTFALFL